MKTFLILLTFIGSLLLGLFIDGAIVNGIAWLAKSLPLAWVIFIKVLSWAILSFFTGGPIFALSFIASGAIKTSIEE